VPDLADRKVELRSSSIDSAEDWVNTVVWSPDGGSVYAACSDGAVISLDCADGEAREVHRHEGPATSLDVSVNGSVASGGHDGTLRSGGQSILLGEGEWVERVSWRPDGERLAAACGRVVHMLDRDGVVQATSRAAEATVTCLGWHPRGINLAAGSYGGVELLRGRDATNEARLPWKGSILELAISPDGRRLAHGNQDATVHFWDVAKRQELHMTGYPRKVRELAWRDDTRFLATGGGTTVTVWDFSGRGPEGSIPLELDQHQMPVTWLGFQPGKPMLASAADDGLLILWTPRRSGSVAAAVACDEPLTCAAWSPDGRKIAVGGAHGKVEVFEVAGS